MSPRPEEIRARLVELPSGTELLRNVRYLHAEDLATCTTEELTNAARWLRAASYSAAEGARRLDTIARNRTTTSTTEGPDTCTSDPTTTARSTSSAEPPTATPPPSDPRSPSSRKTTAPE